MEKDHIKQLLDIAKACRKAGITHFKNDMFEITLSDEAPAPLKPRGKSAGKKLSQDDSIDQIETDTLSDEELLLWSSGVSPDTQSQ